MTPMEFCSKIHSKVAEAGCTYLDAIQLHCEKTGMEPETAAALLTPEIKSRCLTEAENLNLMKKVVVRKKR